ncbi:hypothetical protein OHS18_47920 [Amycolatopsis sp. NBC_00355]|uniref:hypothetical protein n=1 Tax=Amycolatopsis sp. NBC_00355 TaxID=2975957 RepID=UPI002E26794E
MPFVVPFAVLVLLAATVVTALGLLVKMLRNDEPLLGGFALCLLVGPGAVLAFLHLALDG